MCLEDWDEDMIPAKKQVTPSSFNGSILWKKWFARFCENIRTNVWNEAQVLGSLKEVLRDGPEEHTLYALKENGNGPLECLIELAAS